MPDVARRGRGWTTRAASWARDVAMGGQVHVADESLRADAIECPIATFSQGRSV
jgi:hypothetical protein